MQPRSKCMILLVLMMNLLVSPAHAVDSRPPAVNPPGIGEPGHVPLRPRPRPTPVPAPTPEQIAAGELMYRNAIAKYVADLQRAEENYSTAKYRTDQLSWTLASDELYLDEIEANLDFWNTAGDLLGVANGAVWATVTFKVGQDFVASSPVVQAKVAGVLAMMAGASGLAAAKIIQQKQDEYKVLSAKQREVVKSRTEHLLWQMDYGGHGQPAPNSDLENLFPGCTIQSSCIDTWICTTNSGSNRDCEKQQVCESRIVKC